MSSMKMYSIKEIAQQLDVKEETIQGWLRDGQMPGVKMGKAWRINKSELSKWTAAGGVAAYPVGSFNNQPAKNAGEDNREAKQAKVPCEGCGEDVGCCGNCGAPIVQKPLNEDGYPNIMPLTSIEIKGQTMPMRNVRMPMNWSTRFEKVLRFFPEFCGQQNAVVRDAVYWRLRQLEDAMKGDEAEPSGKVWDKNIRMQSHFRRNQQMLESTHETLDMLLAIGNTELISTWIAEINDDVDRMPEPWKELARKQVRRAIRGIEEILDGEAPVVTQKGLKRILEGSEGIVEGGVGKHRLSAGKVKAKVGGEDEEVWSEGEGDD